MPALRLEHLALNVVDPEKTAAWYGEHLGLKVVRAGKDIARTTFLATCDGAVLIELYNNNSAPVPAYAQKHPLELHLAFSSDDPQTEAERLLRAGAVLSEPARRTPAGDEVVMLRDPFGLALQLVKRAQPMLPATV